MYLSLQYLYPDKYKKIAEIKGRIEEDNNHYKIYADQLVGAHIYLDMPSVGATINAILAAVKAKGETIIENAAKEPEVVNVAVFLNGMGAKIIGAGTSEIRIHGVDALKGCYTEVIPDRIEAGTYIILGALTGDKLKIDNIIPEHVEMLSLKLKEMGVPMESGSDYITTSKTEHLKPVKIKTQGYPGCHERSYHLPGTGHADMPRTGRVQPRQSGYRATGYGKEA